MDEQILHAALYGRVSTSMQVKEGYSLDAQRERMASFAHSQGWNIHDYYFDEGISGKNTERPELQRMLEDIEAGNIDVVLVYKLDRLTRSVIDLHEMLSFFEKYNTKFRSVTEVYDTTTATGRLFITLVASFAQYERENLAERVTMGMLQKMDEGKWHGGIIPFGYKQNENGELEINEEEAYIVKKAFELYSKGKGFKKTAVALNDLGYRTRLGNRFSDKTVRDILKNTTYKNEMPYMNKVFKNIAPIIIEPDFFDQVQEMRTTRKLKNPRRLSSIYIFSGILLCARCGTPLSGKRTREKLYYVCTQREQENCDLPYVYAEEVEKGFLEMIKDPFNLPRLMEDLEIKNVEREKIKNEIARIERELQNVKKRKHKWQLAFAAEAITVEDLKSLTQEDNKKEKALVDEIERLTSQVAKETYNPEELSYIVSDLMSNWEYLETEEKKHLVNILVKELYMDTQSEKQSRRLRRTPIFTKVAFN